MLSFKQENPADHVDPNEVLKALGIEGHVDVEKFTTVAEGGRTGGGQTGRGISTRGGTVQGRCVCHA